MIRKLFLLLALASPSAHATLIDFESTPGGSTPVDNAAFTGAYVVGGTSVSFGYDTNNDRVSDASVYYEKYGDSDSTSAYAGDGDTSGLGGSYFLRLPAASSTSLTFLTPGSQFLITYSGVFPSAASGSAWDIDPNEQFSVHAYDPSGVLLQSQSLSPTSANNLPTNFSFSFSGMGQIGYITATSSTGSPFGFDNFSATTASNSVPESGATLVLFGLSLAGLGFGRRFPG